MQLDFQNVTFAYEAMPEPLLVDLSFGLRCGWAGIVGPNGSGKTTILRLACGELLPQQGKVAGPRSVVYCPQRTDDPPSGLEPFLQADEARACELRGRLRIVGDWNDRWLTLSHGERKRAQIGVALWRSPDLLAVDEPANHLDLEGRALLHEALASFSGIGLLVSHDRDLLDSLCRCTLMLSPPTATLRPGSYSAASREARKEAEAARRARKEAKRELERLSSEVRRRQEKAAQADTRRSKRHLALRDSDGRNKLDRARLLGKDGRAGRVASQLARRTERAMEKVRATRAPKEHRLGIWIPGSRSPGDLLFLLSKGELTLGPGRRLLFPDLCMRPADRVALTGPNGGGKSTLIERVIRALPFARQHLTYLPQEIPAAEARQLTAEVGRLSPEMLGHLMTVVSRLGSRPQRLMKNIDPSPGEMRKILLGLGVLRSPYLIVMDEPTNHLDLPAVECLEEALLDCPCGLLLVSHDRAFLRRLCNRGWQIRGPAREEGGGRLQTMELVETDADLVVRS